MTVTVVDTVASCWCSLGSSHAACSEIPKAMTSIHDACVFRQRPEGMASKHGKADLGLVILSLENAQVSPSCLSILRVISLSAMRL